MSTRRRLARLLQRRIPRRALTLPVVVVGGLLSALLAPITVPIAALLDRGRPWQRVRLVALVTGSLVIEVGGIVVATVTWIATGFGLFNNRRWVWHVHRPFMGWYASALLAWIARVLGTSVEWRDEPGDLRGPVVVLARHTSFFDAVIPAVLLSRRNHLLAHHVLTAGLRYLPNLDLVGHRIPTQFIQRTPGQGSTELGPIERLGGLLDDRSAAVIFPEGTFRDEARFERAVRRLRRRAPELAEQAAGFRHVLPPRGAGTHALLTGAPDDVTVIVCANTGLEPFSTLDEIRTSLVADRPIVVETWNVSSADIPKDADAVNAWLLAEYQRIDDWVEAELA